MTFWRFAETVSMLGMGVILTAPKHYHALIVSIELALLAGMFIGRWIERQS